MKPRHKSVPLTFDDVSIWIRLGTRWPQRGVPWMPRHYLTADRCDADLMFFLTRFGVRHWSTWAPRPRPPFWMATAHTLLRIDPEWPAGHHMIDLT